MTTLQLEVFEDQTYELTSKYSKADTARILIKAAVNMLDSDAEDKQ